MAKLNGTPYAAGSHSRHGADPFASVLGIEPKLPVTIMVALALTLHAGAAAAAGTAMMLADMFSWARTIRSAIAAQLTQTYEVDMVKPEAKPPEPEPELQKEKPEEPKEPPQPVIKQQEVKPQAAHAAPPPAAAQAGKILTQEPPKDEPVDLTGNTFVTGSGATFAGGTTQAGGTSKTAVYGTAAVATGVPGGKGTAPAPANDRSRAAGLLGGASWNDCPFPSEADADQIDDAYVTVQVTVKSDGSADAVTVLQDPGHGFGREAKKCAMRKRYTTALDTSGNTIAGTTKAFRVHFAR
ncbi:MAG: energy transducer TonB [Polyangiaceae bacterium]|nr:energy transducer TonB [Polyangiaceae bacterium]